MSKAKLEVVGKIEPKGIASITLYWNDRPVETFTNIKGYQVNSGIIAVHDEDGAMHIFNTTNLLKAVHNVI